MPNYPIATAKKLLNEINPFPLKDNGPDFKYEKLYEEYERELLRWANAPYPLTNKEIEEFTNVCENGLRTEALPRDYITEITGKISEYLLEKNRAFRNPLLLKGELKGDFPHNG